ncbi:YbhB/YbcL family Raf kinase inhibitor-like protein [Fervidobacterium sp.]
MESPFKRAVGSNILIISMILVSFFFATLFAESQVRKEVKKMTISSVFKNGDFIPRKYTCEGQDINPEIIVNNIPDGAKTIAIICDDPDAPIGTFVHWVLWNRPVSGSSVTIPEGIGKAEKLSDGTMQGYNDFGKIGYNGPCPPRGHGVHHYHFKVYAVSTVLELKGKVTKKELEKALNGKILAQAEIIGLYERK